MYGDQVRSVAATPSGGIPPEQVPVPTDSGCPTPLSWQDVLANVRSEGKDFMVPTAGGTVRGRVLGTGLPLIFLGGYAGDHELFALTAWLLREECRCLLIDPPQVSTRAALSAAGELSAVSNSLVQAVDFLERDRFAVVGTEFGAQVALRMMIDHPDRIERSLLHGVSSSRRFSLVERLLIAKWRRAHGDLGHSRLATGIARQNHRAWFPPFDATRWEFFEQNLNRTSLSQWGQRLWITQHCHLDHELGQIEVPVLVLATEGDGRVSHQSQSDVAERLSNVRQEMLDNTGPLVFLTHPHRFAKVLRSFLFDSGSSAQ